MGDKLGVAIVKEACPVCGKDFEGPIVMNRRFSNKAAEDVRALHGKVIGYKDCPCDECKELLTKGFVLIGVEEAKTDNPQNPYRSGHMWCIKKEAAAELFTRVKLDHGFAFIDVMIADSIGLPVSGI